MLSHKLTETELAIRVVPRHVRWPQTGTSFAWTKAHSCVDALKSLVRSVDIACLEAEQDSELSAGAIGRRRVGICDQAIVALLHDFKSFEIAQKAITENIRALELLDERNPDQVQMLEKLTKAIADLREGVEATKRAVLERCKMRQSISA